ncbi:MAG: hypothetical protein WA909_11630 [Castellaniella sp.]
MAMNKSHAPAAQKGVLGMLIDDHREAQQLFKDFGFAPVLPDTESPLG